jgi:hypothetical protein
VTVEKSGITCIIMQIKLGVDRVSRAGFGGASVFVFFLYFVVVVFLFVGHVLIALRYRYDALVGNRKSNYFGE